MFHSSSIVCLKNTGHNFSIIRRINPKIFFMKMLATVTTKLVFLVFLFLAPVIMFAQEGGAKIEVDINKNEGNWYTNPIVWIIGAAVFILLLVALLRGNNSSKS